MNLDSTTMIRAAMGAATGVSLQADLESEITSIIERDDVCAAYQLIPRLALLDELTLATFRIRLLKHFGKEDLDIKNFDALVAKQRDDTPGLKRPAAKAQDPQPDLTGYPHTDTGNAERLVALYGADIHFCTEMKKWLVWDGQRWAIDEVQRVKQMAKRVARLLYLQAGEIGDKEFREATERHARKSESASGINRALECAEHEPGVPIGVAELDRHPWLLNCQNGVLDLKTRDITPHDRSFLITKLCHLNYNPDALCERFLKFLFWAMGAPQNEDSEPAERTTHLIGFLQRAFGYSLTGDVSAKAVFCFFGPKGNNGKTTLLETFRYILSEYSAQVSIETLMTKNQENNATRADLADLRGARFVTTSEAEEGQRLSEGKLKYISAGMGSIKTCRKWENPIEFPATHKLFLDANHRPVVRGTDDAIWSRLKPVPFEVRIEPTDEGFDPDLLNKLRSEGEGILAWAVRGLATFLETGLGEPAEITEEKEGWKEENDPLKDFLDDCCQEGPLCKISDMSWAYQHWCKANGQRFPLTIRGFNDRMESLGYTRDRKYISGEALQHRVWIGISLRPEYADLKRREDRTREDRDNDERYRQERLEDASIPHYYRETQQ